MEIMILILCFASIFVHAELKLTYDEVWREMERTYNFSPFAIIVFVLLIIKFYF